MSIKNTLEFYRQGNFRVFTTNGLIFSILLLILFVILNLLPINFNINLLITNITVSTPGNIFWFLINIGFSVLGAVFTVVIWWILGIKFAPKVGYHVVENSFLRLVLIKNGQC